MSNRCGELFSWDSITDGDSIPLQAIVDHVLECGFRKLYDVGPYDRDDSTVHVVAGAKDKEEAVNIAWDEVWSKEDNVIESIEEGDKTKEDFLGDLRDHFVKPWVIAQYRRI